MTTLSAVRPFRSVLMAILLVGSLTTACKKSGGSNVEVDPRDQYIGTYEGGEGAYNSAITIGTLPLTPEKGATTVTVTKSANPKEIYIDISNRPPRLTAELNGANFSIIDKSSDQITLVINGQRNVIEGNYSATGVFGKDQASGKDAIAMTSTTEGVQSGTTVKRIESINGLRK